jgi:methionyl-tRNA formyltransferase
VKVSILVDNPRSWIIPYVQGLIAQLRARGHIVHYCNEQGELTEGDVACLLSCEKIIPESRLRLHRHNLVCHPSALPLGKGFSPLAWQIVEGRNEVPLTLFEAVPAVDAGPIYFQELLRFEGHELNEEIKRAQGEKTVELVLRWIDRYPDVSSVAQSGEESIYRRRTAKDSELDPQKTIAEQFELLRVVDNERYPAFFNYRGHSYVLRIEKQNR